MPGIVGAPDLIAEAAFAGAGSFEEASHELFKIGTEVTVEHLALTLVSVFIVSFGLFSGFIKEKLYIGEAIIATVIGIFFSGYVGGVFSPRSWADGQAFDDITLELTRVVIALSVFAVGVELPKAYVLKHWRSLSILLGPVMLFGWILAGALIYALIPGLEFLPSLVIAAGLSPTDPILASSVVGKGKFAQDHVPAHIRHLLQAESGANDGAAFPFLYLALFLLLRDHYSVGQAVGYWFILVILYQIVLGIAIGAVIGIAARKLLKFSKRRKLIDRESMVAMYVALAFLVTGITTLAGSDDLLAAFACGTAFAWDDWFTESIEESNFSSIIDLLVNSLIFIYLGATMPFSAWNDATLTLTPWRLVILAILILGLKRLPVIFLLHRWMPDIKTRREAIFCGHFGPVGVGALFISTLAASKLPTPSIPPQTNLDLLSLTIQPITYFIILSSVLVHGLTISFFSLGRRVHSRVQSISRTFTQASGAGEEPSWMSRVKRVTAADQIVINRDEGDEDIDDLAEKGDLGKQDLNDEKEEGEDEGDSGLLAMFGAPSSGSSSNNNTATASSSSSVDKKGEESEKDGRGENDEHPSENVLGDKKSDRDHHVDADDGEDSSRVKSRDYAIGKNKEGDLKQEENRMEEKYCKSDEDTTWNEGKQIVIDRKDGEEVEVIDLHPTNSRIESAKVHPDHTLITVPVCAIENEKQLLDKEGKPVSDENAVKRFIQRRRAGSLAQAVAKIVGDDLTSEQREARRRDKLARDAWCRKEMHYRDRDDESSSSNSKVKSAVEWKEGNKIVLERGDEDIDVRDMTVEEREARAARHLAALKKLGRPLEKVEAELLKLTRSVSNESDPTLSNKGKETGQPSTSQLPPPVKSSGTGLSLTRTSRVVEDDEEGEDDEDQDWNDEVEAAPKPTFSSRPTQIPRANSRVRAMKDLIFHRDKSPEKMDRGRLNVIDSANNSRSNSPNRASIRFAVPSTRDSVVGSTSTSGRVFPAVGGLGIKREPTK